MKASERASSGPVPESGRELAAQADQPDDRLAPDGKARLAGKARSAGRARRRELAAPAAGVSRRGARVTALGSRAGEAGAQAARAGARAAGRGARAAGRGARWGAKRLVDEVLTRAPRLPVRDQATLRAQYPGRSPEELADTLIDGAARMSASVGAAVGTWAVVPFLPGIPAEVATETVTVVGIEIKLIAELHEVYGMRAPGTVVDRMTAYTAAWANRRGVGLAPAGLILAVGSPLRRRLQRRLAARAGQSMVSLGPLLTGAAAGALLNRHETRRLGGEVRDDLRKRSAISAHWPD
jgi:hypothetical protein